MIYLSIEIYVFDKSMKTQSNSFLNYLSNNSFLFRPLPQKKMRAGTSLQISKQHGGSPSSFINKKFPKSSKQES